MNGYFIGALVFFVIGFIVTIVAISTKEPTWLAIWILLAVPISALLAQGFQPQCNLYSADTSELNDLPVIIYEYQCEKWNGDTYHEIRIDNIALP